VLSTEATNTSFIVFGVSWPGLEKITHWALNRNHSVKKNGLLAPIALSLKW
jgi:hypothetical protein